MGNINTYELENNSSPQTRFQQSQDFEQQNSFFFQIQKRSATEFHLTAKDSDRGFFCEAELIIKTLSQVINKVLPAILETDFNCALNLLSASNTPQILICKSVHLDFSSRVGKISEVQFVKFLSQVLEELLIFTLKQKIQGLMFLVQDEQIASLTSLQKGWLYDFHELLDFTGFYEGIHYLYLSPSFERMKQHYLLHSYLENSIAANFAMQKTKNICRSQ